MSPLPRLSAQTWADIVGQTGQTRVNLPDCGGIGDPISNIDLNSFRIFSRNINGIPCSKQLVRWREHFKQAFEYNIECFCLNKINLQLSPSAHFDASTAAREEFHAHVMELASSKIEVESNFKPGGTACLIQGRWANRVIRKGQDEYGMGRWSYVTMKGKDGELLTIISCYRTCRGGTKGVITAHAQQWSILEKDDRKTTPREAFFDYLGDFLNQTEGKKIICGDFNESLTENQDLAEFLHQHSLVDTFEITHPGGEEFQTYTRGSKRLDYIFISQEAAKFINGSGYTNFGFGVTSDHRGQFLDIDLDGILGEAAVLPPNKNQIIKSTRPSDVKRYRKKLWKKCTKEGTFESIAELIKVPKSEWTDVHQQKLDEADDSLVQCALECEKSLCKFPKTPWSPQLAQAVLRFRFWQLVARSTKNKYDATYSLAQLNKKLKRKIPLQNWSSEETTENLIEARKFLRSCNKNASNLRKEFLVMRSKAEAVWKNTSKSGELKSLEQNDQSRRTYVQIARLRNKRIPAPTSSILVPDNFVSYPYDTKDVKKWKHINDSKEVEDLLLERNKKHFSQAKGTPWTTSKLGKIPFSGTGKLAEKILSEDYDDASYTEACRHLIGEMKRRTNAFDLELSLEEVTLALRKWSEKTSTSPSGRHLGHLKSLITPDGESRTSKLSTAEKGEILLGAITDMLNISTKHGRPLERWKQVVNSMIEKEEGKPYLHRFRVIHIYENDYNLLLKLLISHRLLHHAEKFDLLDEAQGGSRPGRSAHDIVLKKHLAFCVARRSLTKLALFENDATACYDRIIPSQSNLATRALGLPEEIAKIHGKTLEGMTFQVKTANGISSDSYCHTVESPVYGTGQGSCASPIVWRIISCLLFKIMMTRFAGAHFSSPDRKHTIKKCMDGFVDDTHLLAGDFKNAQTPLELISSLQSGAQRWEELLHATGGKLELPKCSFTFTMWAMDEHGIPHMQNVVEPEIKIRSSETGNYESIKYVRPGGSIKTLGVMFSASTNMVAEYARLKSNVERHIRVIAGTGLKYSKAWIYVTSVAIPSITYGLSVSTLGRKKLSKLQSPLMKAQLQACGYNCNTPRGLAHAPYKCMGLGIPSFYALQGAKATTHLLRHMRKGLSLGTQIMIDISWAQLEAGTSFSIFNRPIKNLPQLSNGWITSIGSFIQSIGYSIFIPGLRIPTKRRAGDKALMDEAIRNHTDYRARMINICRLFLRVEMLSDICDETGTRIQQWAWRCVRPIHDESYNLIWPRMKRPHPDIIKIWRRFLREEFCHADCTLHEKMGEWIYGNHNGRVPESIISHNRLWKGPASSNDVYQLIKSDRLTRTWKKIIGCKRPELFVPTRATTMNEDTVKTKTTLLQDEMIQDREIFTDRLLSKNEIKIPDWMDLEGDLTAGSDGGAKDGKGYYGFVIYKGDKLVCEGRGSAWGNPQTMDPLRAEAFGLLALHCTLERLFLHTTFGFADVKISTDSQSSLDRLSRLKYSDTDLNVFTMPHADIFAELSTRLKKDPPAALEFVPSHADDHKDRSDWTHKEVMNVRCDRLATQARHEMEAPVTSGPDFPTECAKLVHKGQQIDSKIYWRLLDAEGLGKQALYMEKSKGWSNEEYNSVHWDAIQSAMSNITRAQARQITKFAHNWLPVGTRVRRYDILYDNVCPRCEEEIETDDHLLQCCALHATGTNTVWGKTWEFLDKESTLEQMAQLIKRKLMRIAKTEDENDDPLEDNQIKIPTQDRLGWINFAKGFVSSEISSTNDRYLSPIKRSKSWTTELIEALWADFLVFWESRNDERHSEEMNTIKPDEVKIARKTREVHTKLVFKYPNAPVPNITRLLKLPTWVLKNFLVTFEPLIHPSHNPPGD